MHIQQTISLGTSRAHRKSYEARKGYESENIDLSGSVWASASSHIGVLLVGVLLVAGLFFGMGGVYQAAAQSKTASSSQLPKEKQTTLGLYVTAKEAYDKWSAAPDAIKVFDVRALEEYLFVGHAPMAWNIPLLSQTHEWDVKEGYFTMKPNPDFLSQVKEVAELTDTVLVMCRSGGRSAMAINLLAKAGYTNVYQITDGMEGDAVIDPESVFQGQRLRNGWKNSGLPWTYKPDPERIKLKYSPEATVRSE